MRSIPSFIFLFIAPFLVFAGATNNASFPGSKAEATIQRIISTVGLKPNFEIKTSDIYDASATVLNGKRYIFYNPDFFEKLNYRTGSEWSSISILAHEIGHHLNGHTLSGGKNSPEIELEADEFSGFVLRKMGASLKESQQAIQMMAGRNDSETHPAKDKRLLAIERGWSSADHQGSPINDAITIKKEESNTSTASKTVQPSKRVEPVKKVAQVPANYIRYVVRIHSQPGVIYYLTAQNNLVRFRDNNFYIVGKIRESGIASYPYILTGTNAKFYVTKKGNIVDSKGKIAGFVKSYDG